ncbi:MAG: MarR family transcriptional regulator [Armatimonadetes bacterium]|nr:MarR family transcriptional regulator [Armatimonadota bacterium]MDE2205610.1 MarR family transcriptional regulator [Armatimonadota bacterium]
MSDRKRHPQPPLPAAIVHGCSFGAPQSDLHRLFKEVAQAFRQRALELMRAEGITELFPGAAPVILQLSAEEGITMSELARRCGWESSTITALADELENAGIVVRERDGADRRTIRLRLTESGRLIEPRLRDIATRLQQEALVGVTQEELNALSGALERMAANLAHAGEPA